MFASVGCVLTKDIKSVHVYKMASVIIKRSKASA